MSWLGGSLLIDDETKYKEEEGQQTHEEIDLLDADDDMELPNNFNDDDDDFDERRGIEEDLSEFTQTLRTQFWGVASFLAPPPPPPPPPSISINRGSSKEDLLAYYFKKDDFDDGKSGNRRFYDNAGDGQLRNRSLMKEDDLRGCYENGDGYDVGDEEEEEEEDEEEEEVEDDAVGVTEEALAFAHNIAHHPETWLDFPIEEDEEEGFQDFLISDSQYKHALAIERCVPTLAALRIELCPVHMSEGYFWMVYFVLLHSRLNKNDADQLSSAELVQARSTWREELKKKEKPETDWFGRSTFCTPSTLSPRENFDHEVLEDSETRQLFFNSNNAGSRFYHPSTYNETEKQIVECDEVKSADTPSGNSERDFLTFQSSQIIQDANDSGEDDWLQDTADLDGYLTTGIVVNEEDVSFSDLEEDSDWTMPIRSK